MERRLRQTLRNVQRRPCHALYSERQSHCRIRPPAQGGARETPLGRYYGSDDWDASSATLQYDEQDDTFYLHVTLKNPDYKVDGTERQEAGSRDDTRENGWFSAWI